MVCVARFIPSEKNILFSKVFRITYISFIFALVDGIRVNVVDH